MANFAYNPENHLHFLQLKIHDIFLSNIASDDDAVALFSLKGLANLASLPSIAALLIKKNQFKMIVSAMESRLNSEDFIINGLLIIMIFKSMNIIESM